MGYTRGLQFITLMSIALRSSFGSSLGALRSLECDQSQDLGGDVYFFVGLGLSMVRVGMFIFLLFKLSAYSASVYVARRFLCGVCKPHAGAVYLVLGWVNARVPDDFGWVF